MFDGENGMQNPGEPVAIPAAPVAAPGATTAEPAADGPVDPPPATVNPAALTVAQAARLLGVAEDVVRGRVAAGAPTAADGTINLVHYVAWMNKQLAGTDGD